MPLTVAMMAINVMAGQQLWTNMALDAGPVMMGRVQDPITGTLTIDQYNEDTSTVDLRFQDVTLQNMRDGSLCVINGRLRTNGQTYGY